MGKQEYNPKLSLPGEDGGPRSLGAIARQYLLSSVARGYSARTVETRLIHLRHFLGWCMQHALLWPEQLTRSVLERYLRHLSHAESSRTGCVLSPQVQLMRFGAVRCLLRWAVRAGLVEHNAASDIEHVWPGRTLPKRILSKEEAERLMSQPPIKLGYGLRDRAILETLYSTGLRRAELVGLDVVDLNEGRSVLLVRKGKGRKERYVPMGVRAMWWVGKYLEDARPAMVGTKQQSALFVSKSGERFNLQYLGLLVRKYMRSAELGERGGCHVLRHSCATQMLEGGADIRYIQALLGHAKLETTEIYTHVSIEKLREVHSATHPAEQSRTALMLKAAAQEQESPEPSEVAQEPE